MKYLWYFCYYCIITWSRSLTCVQKSNFTKVLQHLCWLNWDQFSIKNFGVLEIRYRFLAIWEQHFFQCIIHYYLTFSVLFFKKDYIKKVSLLHVKVLCYITILHTTINMNWIKGANVVGFKPKVNRFNTKLTWWLLRELCLVTAIVFLNPLENQSCCTTKVHIIPSA